MRRSGWIIITIILAAAIAVIMLLMNKNEQKATYESVSGKAVFGLALSGGGASTEAVSVNDTDDMVTGSGVSVSGGAVIQSELEKKSIHYSEQIVAGLFTEIFENATDQLKKETTPDELALSYESVTSDLSGYVGVESSREDQTTAYRQVSVTLRYAGNKGSVIRYIYNSDEKLSGIWFDTLDLSISAEKGSEYDEKEIMIGVMPYVLNGILTLPVSSPTEDKKPPLVILISAEDDMDMDGTIGTGGNKPLKDMARGLAKRGVATIRYNKRMNQYAKTVTAGADIYDLLLRDVYEAINAATRSSDADTDRVYILAWGKSASYLPVIVKKRSRRLAGAIMIGAKPEHISESSYIDGGSNTDADARYFATENTTFPLLFLQGMNDFETTKKYYEKWQSLLKGRAHTQFHGYEGLGHYLFSGKKSGDSTDYDVSDNVNGACIKDIANWCMAP